MFRNVILRINVYCFGSVENVKIRQKHLQCCGISNITECVIKTTWDVVKTQHQRMELELLCIF